MTDSLARIAAEQAADHALEATHPDPLAIAGELQARAAGRCTRKRALWARDWCDGCPFRGCEGCEFQGGVDPAKPFEQQAFFGQNGYNGSGPEGAATPRGLSPTEAAKPTGRTRIT